MSKKAKKAKIPAVIKAKIANAKGQKPQQRPPLNYYEIEVIKAYLAVEKSIREVARKTGRSADTIRRIRDLKEEDIEYYRSLKRKEFVLKAWEKIDMLTDEITRGKCFMASVNQITTALGTMYDKAALASGEATQRAEIEVKGIADKIRDDPEASAIATRLLEQITAGEGDAGGPGVAD